MKAVCSVAVRLGICLAAICVSATANPITVTGSRVNLRAIADPRSEIVGQVSKGDVLTATGVTREGWVEISAPETAVVWVYGELVRDNMIAASSVRVRSGPGIGYRPVGTLSKGQSVRVIAHKGDWVQIAPPQSCTVWISTDYISDGTRLPPTATKPPEKRASRNLEKPTKKPARDTRKPVSRDVRKPPAPKPPSRQQVAVRPEPEPKPSEPARKPSVSPRELRQDASSETEPSKPPAPREATQAILNLRLVRNAPQGREIIVTGEIRPVGFFPLGRPSPYRLVLTKGAGPAETICYVIGNRAAIARYMDSRVTLVGQEYWVQGVREPVVSVRAFRD